MTKPSPSLPKGHAIWFNSDLVEQVTNDWFEPGYWRKQGRLNGSALGRGTTYFLRYQNRNLVLRHYKRGGLIGKFLNDQYIYAGLNKTRAWQEFQLLLKLGEIGLPAPTPVAARVKRQLGYYTADLITAKIDNAHDVHELLIKRSLSAEMWESIGSTIALFHKHQVYHHDLNIHNIMLDLNKKIWLIDFERCAIKSGQKWKQDNLSRLNRSLKKEFSKAAHYHYTEQNWLSLLDGYQKLSVGNPSQREELV
jgi:3-deoxy-D-manno-octulosonic acid kinase